MSRLKGHALVRRGWPHWNDGEAHLAATAGGSARCKCGAMSPWLPSRNERKRWHRGHKEQVRREQGNG